jgi:O-antigen/teichoic acid export membrane protein
MDPIKPESKWKRILDLSSFTNQVIVTMGTNIVSASLALLTGILAARMLGPQGRGELAAIQTWPMFLASMAMLGLPEALVFYSAKKHDTAGKYLTSAMVTALIACIPFGIIGLLILPKLLTSQSAETISAAKTYLWILPIYALQGMLIHPLRGRKDIFNWNLLRLLPSLGWIVILIINLITGTFTAQSLAMQFLLLLALLFIPMGTVILKKIPGPFRSDIQSIRQMLVYGLPAFLSGLPSMVNLRLDQFLIMGLLGPQLLGLYVVAVSWSTMPLLLISALGAMIVPHVAERNSAEQQKNRISQSIRIGTLLAFTLTIFLLILTPIAIPLLFGDQFREVVNVAILLCIAGGFVGMNQLLESGALGLGKPKFVLLAECVGMAITILLLSLLLPPFELMGAAVASLVSYSTISVIMIILIVRFLRIKPLEILIPQRQDLSLFSQKSKSILNTIKNRK